MMSRARLMVLYFVLLHASVVLTLLGLVSARVAVGAAIASLIPLALSGFYLVRRIQQPLTWLDVWVLVYTTWSLASVVLYFQPGAPSRIGAYAYGSYYFVLPIACYFAVKAIPRLQQQRLLDAFVLLNAFVVVYGVYMHITRPDYYQQFLGELLAQKGYTEEWQFYARLQSYLGSTSVGYLSVMSIVLSTIASDRIKRMLPVLVPVFIVGIALSFQRASLLGGAIAVTYLLFVYRGHRMLRLAVAASLLGGGVYLSVRYSAEIGLLAEQVESRATSDVMEGVSRLTTERGYGPGFRYLSSFPIGVGLGATSSAAESAGLSSWGQVVDANYMRVAADLGIMGLCMLLLIFIAIAVAAWRSAHGGAWIVFLVIHMGIMITTNIFDGYYISHAFWALAALADTDRAATPSWQSAEPVRAGSAVLA